MASNKTTKNAGNPQHADAKFQIGWKVPCLWRDDKYRTFAKHCKEGQKKLKIRKAGANNLFYPL